MSIVHSHLQVSFSDIEDLNHALAHEYTTTFQDACIILQTSRQWIQRFVRPFVPYVYVSPKQGRELGITKNIFIHTKAFEDLISRNLSFSRKTIQIPVCLLLEQNNQDAVIKKYDELCAELNELRQQPGISPRILHMLNQEIYDLIGNHLSRPEERAYLHPDYKRRTQYKQLPCPFTLTLSKMRALPTVMHPGDCPEAYFRQLFVNGAIRCELNLPDRDGVSSQKVYYAFDPTPPHPITLAYEDYLQMQQARSDKNTRP